jgi:hypothetical protein
VIRRMVVLCSLLAMLSAVVSGSHAGDVQEMIQRSMSEVASNSVISTKTEDIVSKDPSIVLAELSKYEHSPNHMIRWNAYCIGYDLGKNSSDPKVRQEVVSRLVNSCEDPDPRVWQSTSEFLLSFAPEDFNESAHQVIHRLMASEAPGIRFIILCGIAEDRDMIPRLQKIANGASGKTAAFSPAWYAHLSLARMGNKIDTGWCIKLFQSEKDVVTKVARLLNHLAFTRQPEVIPVLQQYLDMEDRLPSVKETIPGLPYWQYALNVTALTIEGFPVKYKWTPGYSEEEVEIAREWMNEQKSFRFRKTTVNPHNLF